MKHRKEKNVLEPRNMTCQQIISDLNSMANPEDAASMARYGISPMGTLGVSSWLFMMGARYRTPRQMRTRQGSGCVSGGAFIASVLLKEFLAEVRRMPQRNLAVEMLRKLLDGEVKKRSRKNIVQGRSFAEMLRTIAQDLLKTDRNNAAIDWTVRAFGSWTAPPLWFELFSREFSTAIPTLILLSSTTAP